MKYFHSSHRISKLTWLCAIVLTIHAIMLAWSAYRHSPVFDEWGHLPAGVSHWKHGRYDLYRVNPPLVRMVAALPLLCFDSQMDLPSAPAYGLSRPEFDNIGSIQNDEFFFHFTLGRWVCISFSLLGGIVCFLWGRDLYNPLAGFAALLLWCFSPTVLGHAQFLTPDCAAASFGLLASYLFWKWLRDPGWTWAFLAGIALGLALLTKFTWIILPALWPCLWLLWKIPCKTKENFWGELLQGTAMILISLFIVNSCYEFQGSFQQLGKYRFISKTLRPVDTEFDWGRGLPKKNRFTDSMLGMIPVPLPGEYVLGIDRQKWDFDDNVYKSYLCGVWQDHGWWYYYLFATLIKEPIGTLLLFFMALSAGSLLKRPCFTKDEILLLIPGITVFVLVSSQTGFNHHVRYVLPAYPFFYIFSMRLFTVQFFPKITKTFVACCMGGTITSVMLCYPHCMSYFNELTGHHRNGHYYLNESNLDWGQDMIYVREWLDRHPEVKLDGMSLHIGMNQMVNEDCPLPPPKEPKPGWYLMSLHQIHVYSGDYLYFLKFQPYDVIAWSHVVYHISLEEVNQVRNELGLQKLEK
jgi:hypothetical protein